jgi:cytochrome P450
MACCIGAHLARLEVKVASREWLLRIPDFEVLPDAEISYWPGGVVGPKSLPLVW